MAKSSNRIKLHHLMYVRYKHKDIFGTNKFLLDFGFTAVAETADKIWYRGFGESPVSYISEKSESGKAEFLGGGWAVDDYADLELAASLPGASSVTECESQIGGKMVTVKDPVGVDVYLHWGYSNRSKEDIKKPKELTFNTWERKRRLGEFQRLPGGPANVHKLGHYGFEISDTDFESVREWYLATFTLRITDSQFDPETGKDIMTFIRMDRGKEFVDHHSFFLIRGELKSGYDVHHSSFEVDDFDSELKGHVWLQKKGWELVWGVGRHLLGSQIFDYWFDTDGFVVEHYADGDQVNSDHVVVRVPATPESISIWGPHQPLSFMTKNPEDRGKLVPTPEVSVGG